MHTQGPMPISTQASQSRLKILSGSDKRKQILDDQFSVKIGSPSQYLSHFEPIGPNLGPKLVPLWVRIDFLVWIVEGASIDVIIDAIVESFIDEMLDETLMESSQLCQIRLTLD